MNFLGFFLQRILEAMLKKMLLCSEQRAYIILLLLDKLILSYPESNVCAIKSCNLEYS